MEAPIRMAHGLLPGMLERGEGHLVFISSLNAKAGTPRSSIYTGTKAALRSFALALRSDLGAKNIGVSVVSPGLIRDAGMFAKSGARAPAIIGSSTPEAVGVGVVRAIERNKAEIAVAPLRQRALSHFALSAPRVAAWALGGGPLKGKATRVADDVTEAKAANR
jgi:short-subunit dehydrogenase